MGYVADETLRQASALEGVHAPELVFSLDDMKSAYRQIPTADPEMCIIRGTDTLDPSAASGIPRVSLTTTGSRY